MRDEAVMNGDDSEDEMNLSCELSPDRGAGEAKGISQESIVGAVAGGDPSGIPSLIQSRFGYRGNFEMVTPLSLGGLAHYWRNNDEPGFPWHGPIIFGGEAGQLLSACLIRSNFGGQGNLELAATDVGGHRLMHFWCGPNPDLKWNGPVYITEPSLTPVFSGNPSLIQGRFGYRGNFELVVPLAEGGLAHYWRDNDDPDLSWHGPTKFGQGEVFSSTSMIQSNFELPGKLEVVARTDDRLAYFWRSSGPDHSWNGPFFFETGVSGNPSLIQGKFGEKGNFELVVPLAEGGIGHFFRDNDDEHQSWYGPFEFAAEIGKVDSVALIQSNFEDPGNLELIARVGNKLAFFWRGSGPKPEWHGPQKLEVITI